MRADPLLREWARQMRGQPTMPEKWLWMHLCGSQLGGFKFRRQAAISPFIVDFFCPAKGLIVEVDGETHIAVDDERRDALLAKRGFTTIRFTNDTVLDNIDGVLSTLLERLNSLPDRWSGSTAGPTPSPPLKGRG